MSVKENKNFMDLKIKKIAKKNKKIVWTSDNSFKFIFLKHILKNCF